jgi:hypothetical protein
VFANSESGTGTLTASGRGRAAVKGTGEINITGAGVLMVRDKGGDAIIEVDGKGTRSELSNGWIRYKGYEGSAYISGTDVEVVLTGVNIDLLVNGTGKVILRGRGTYQVGDLKGVWTLFGKTVVLP